MAFNDNPYIKVLLDSEDLTEEGYSKITVDENTVVWRKPINYIKKLNICDNSSGIVVKSSDAVGDGAMSFNLKRLEDNSWVECLTPEDNNTSLITGGPQPVVLGSQKVIKYEDVLKYSYTISPGYTLKGVEHSSMTNPSGEDIPLASNTSFTVLNDFSLEVNVKPVLYTLTLNIDTDIASCSFYRVAGQVATIQGVTSGAFNILTDKAYYGDILIPTTNILMPGYYVSDLECSIGFYMYAGDRAIRITDNVTLTVITAPYKSRLIVDSTQASITSLQINRTPGQVAIREGAIETDIISGEYLYVGDVIEVEATTSTGHSLDTITIPEFTESYVRDNPTTTLTLTTHWTIGSFTVIPNEGVSNVTMTVVEIRGVEKNYTITNGSDLEYGTTIRIDSEAESGYTLDLDPSFRYVFYPEYEGEAVEFPYITASRNYGLLNLVADSDSIASYSMTRISSPVEDAPLGPIGNNDRIYNDDVLQISYSTNANYIVGGDSGYVTSTTKTVLVDDIITNGSTWTYNIKGEYTIPVPEAIELGIRDSRGTASLIDNEDKFTLYIIYPDSSTEIPYDSTKRVSVEDHITIKAYQPDFKPSTGYVPKFEYIAKLEITYDNGSTVSYTGNKNTTFAISMALRSGAKLSSINIYSMPVKVNVSATALSDIVKSISPEATTLTILRKYSSYSGETSQVSTTINLLEGAVETVSGINIYYKDYIQVSCTDITGWTFKIISLWTYRNSSWSKVAEVDKDQLYRVLSADYLRIQIDREIKNYSLKFYNRNAKYSSILIDNVQQLSSAWVGGSSDSVKTYDVPYGTSFSKDATVPEYNDPMNYLTNSHDNNTTYYVTKNTSVYHRYSPVLISPTISSITYNITSTELQFRIEYTNPNNSYGNPYTSELSLETGSNTYTSTFNSNSGVNTIEYNLPITRGNNSYTLDIFLYLKILGKTLGSVSRTSSGAPWKSLSITIPSL